MPEIGLFLLSERVAWILGLQHHSKQKKLKRDRHEKTENRRWLMTLREGGEKKCAVSVWWCVHRNSNLTSCHPCWRRATRECMIVMCKCVLQCVHVCDGCSSAGRFTSAAVLFSRCDHTQPFLPLTHPVLSLWPPLPLILLHSTLFSSCC